jgi:hypothetical protein
MSEKPYIQEFEMPDGRVFSSVVMDREEFEALIDELREAEIHGLTPEVAEKVKQAGHVPMMARGTKTEFVFERYGASGKMISMIVRGQGRRIAEAMIEAAEQKLRQQAESN